MNIETHTPNKYAFTLVEIAVVLVIIGFIIGGVLVGRDLINASEIRSQISQIESFKTAVVAFRVKYGYLPGDIPPSETTQLGFFTFTGTNAGKPANGGGGPPVGYQRFGFGDNSGDIQTGETYVFWQHLSEANMISGQYGKSSDGSNCLTPDTTSITQAGSPVLFPVPISCLNLTPVTNINSSSLSVQVNLVMTALKYYSDSSLLNFFRFNASASQEFAIDSKIDDAFPDKGRVRDFGTQRGFSGAAPCLTMATPNAYDLTPATSNNTVCSLTILW